MPPNLVDQWAYELLQVTSALRVYVYYGDYRQPGDITDTKVICSRLSKDHKLFNGDAPNARAIVLTSYGTLTTRHGPPAAMDWSQEQKLSFNKLAPIMPKDCPHNLSELFHVAVLDEAHCLRNPSSAQSIAIRWLRPTFNLLLTGTPFFNGITDMTAYAPLLFKPGARWNSDRILAKLRTTTDLFAIPVGDDLESELCTHSALDEVFKKDAVQSGICLPPHSSNADDPQVSVVEPAFP